jgi:hypothetical protein
MVQGVASNNPSGLSNVVEQPRFPQDPYVVTTTLWERADGRLIP